MGKYLLEVDAIAKQFHTAKAVDGLSFRVQRGEVFALLGPNGAGKTTTVRMLMGLIHPDQGKIRYSLRDSQNSAPLPSELGYLPEDRGLYRDIAIFRTLVYMGMLRWMNQDDATAAAEYWLEKVGLKERANDKLDTLSKGNQQKVQFIAAILHQPAFAILDEPFAGLDPVNQDFFLEIIRELRDSGTTVLLCAHQMNLVERLADRVLLMNLGQQVLKGTIPEIKERAQVPNKMVLTIGGDQDVSALRRLPTVAKVEALSNGRFAFLIEKENSLSDFLAAVASSLQIKDVHSETISLHEIFIQAVGDAAKGQNSGEPA